MTPAATRRIPAPLSALTALAALAMSATLALVTTPGHAAPQADFDVKLTMNVDVTIKSNDTYNVHMDMIDSSTGVEALTEDSCSAESFKELSSDDYYKNAKFTFKEEGDTRTCTIEGSGKITDAKGITHEKGEYIVDATSGGSSSTADSVPGLELNYSVTFPGKVTEADGGKVEGNKVTFTDLDSHTVRGGDGSTPVWVWILIAVGALVVIGGGAAAFFITRSKNNKGQPSPYGPVPTQGYDPNPAFQAQPGQPYGGQPGQQAGYSAPQAQPGQPYGGQPGPSY